MAFKFIVGHHRPSTLPLCAAPNLLRPQPPPPPPYWLISLVLVPSRHPPPRCCRRHRCLRSPRIAIVLHTLHTYIHRHSYLRLHLRLIILMILQILRLQCGDRRALVYNMPTCKRGYDSLCEFGYLDKGGSQVHRRASIQPASQPAVPFIGLFAMRAGDPHISSTTVRSFRYLRHSSNLR